MSAVSGLDAGVDGDDECPDFTLTLLTRNFSPPPELLPKIEINIGGTISYFDFRLLSTTGLKHVSRHTFDHLNNLRHL